MTRLQRLDWPDNGTPDLPPAFTLEEAEPRLAAVRAAMAGAGYQALVVYGDREHAAIDAGFDGQRQEIARAIFEIVGIGRRRHGELRRRRHIEPAAAFNGFRQGLEGDPGTGIARQRPTI